MLLSKSSRIGTVLHYCLDVKSSKISFVKWHERDVVQSWKLTFGPYFPENLQPGDTLIASCVGH